MDEYQREDLIKKVESQEGHRNGVLSDLGTPYHLQGRGKIERFNRRIKEKLCLMVYCSTDELKKAINEAIGIAPMNRSIMSLPVTSMPDKRR